jgi:hypothetical protein
MLATTDGGQFMNAVGKILVIFVFVFSMAAAGLMLFVFTTRTDWKKQYDAVEVENVILRNNEKAFSKTIADQKTQNDLALADLRTKLKAREDEASKLRDDIKILAADLESEKLKVAEAIASAKKSEDDAKRLELANKDLLQVIEKRDLEIVKLETENRKEKVIVAQERGRAEAAIARVQGQEERINQLEKTLLERDLARTSLTQVKDPNQPHPPAVSITGRVTYVDGKDPSIIEVSLGTDHGLNKDNTLDVYRLDPRPEYLGMVKIMRADPHTSIGKMMRVAGVSPSPVRKGDSVSSDITRAK